MQHQYLWRAQAVKDTTLSRWQSVADFLTETGTTLTVAEIGEQTQPQRAGLNTRLFNLNGH